MKKVLLLLLLIFYGFTSLHAMTNPPLTTIELKCEESHKGDGYSVLRPRTPVNPPTIYQDGHTILFGTAEFCNSVVVVDINTGETVYEVELLDEDTQVSLPESLIGLYEIRFCRDSYYFYGFVEL